MAAGKYSFTIEQGATTDFEIVYKDANGDRIDLSNYQARMQIRALQTGSGDIYLTLSSSLQDDGTGLNMSGSNGTTSPVSGAIGIYISAVTSSELNFAQGYYDLEIATGSGADATVTRLLEGVVKLSQQITTGSF